MVDATLHTSSERPRRRRSAQIVQLQPPPPSPPAPRFKIELIAVAVALAAQFAGLVWKASEDDHRLASLERVAAPWEDGSMYRQLGHIEERSSQQAKDMDEVKGWMRRISDRLEAMHVRHTAD